MKSSKDRKGTLNPTHTAPSRETPSPRQKASPACVMITDSRASKVFLGSLAQGLMLPLALVTAFTQSGGSSSALAQPQKKYPGLHAAKQTSGQNTGDDVDDTVNPFDDAESKRSNQGSAPRDQDISGGILELNHFENQETTLEGETSPTGSLPLLEEGFESKKPSRKKRPRHEWGQKDMEKALSTRQKKTAPKAKTPVAPMIRDDIAEKRRESQEKASAHVRHIRDRENRAREKSKDGSRDDSVTRARNRSLEGSVAGSLDKPVRGLPPKPSLAPRHDGSPSVATRAGLETVSDSRSQGGLALVGKPDAKSHGASDTRGKGRTDPASDPIDPERRMSADQIAENSPSNQRDEALAPSDQKPGNRSLFDERDFDRVPHLPANHDPTNEGAFAQRLSRPAAVYEPTLYAEDDAVSLLKGSSVTRGQKTRGPQFASQTGEIHDESVSPFESQSPGESYDLDSGLFGDPFVAGTLSSSKAEHDLDPTLATDDMSDTARRGTVRNISLWAQPADAATSSLAIPFSPPLGEGTRTARATQSQNRGLATREGPEDTTLTDMEGSVSSSGDWKSSVPTLGPSSSSASRTEPAAVDQRESRQLASQISQDKILISPKTVVKRILHRPPAPFTLSLAVRQNHTSLNQLGAQYQMIQKSLVNNAVAQGSLKFGIIGYPLSDLERPTSLTGTRGGGSDGFRPDLFSGVFGPFGLGGWAGLVAAFGLCLAGASALIFRGRALRR